MAVPINKSLYNSVKKEAKRKFKVWPSAYGSAWLVKEYKRRGGKYSGSKKSFISKSQRSKRSKRKQSKINSRNNGLSRWFKERWIDVCKLPRKVSCGRSKSSRKNYPYCRPLYRVNKNTPKTVREISMKELKSRCKRKRKSPYKKVYSKNKRSKRKSK